MPTALIVDDNQDNRNVFRTALEIAGYDVREAENGQAGLIILETETFDLLTLDLQMPLVSGETVLRAVRPRPIHTQMQIVVVTANPHMETTFISEAADHVMFKPIDIRQFIDFAKRLAESNATKTEDSSAVAPSNPAT
jgi:CheY-like chemotaxis protein